MIESHFSDVRQKYPGAELAALPSGAHLVTLPGFPVAPGWTAAQTTVRFIVPPGYPFANPDCFFADAGLRLSNGGMPQASALNVIPETQTEALWFSWHLTSPWNPNVDNLMSWIATCAQRFKAAQ